MEERMMKTPLLVSIKTHFDTCEEDKEITVRSYQTHLLGRGLDPGCLRLEEKMKERLAGNTMRRRRSFFAYVNSIPWVSNTLQVDSPHSHLPHYV